MINYRLVFNILGTLLLFNGAFMLLALFFSWHFKEDLIPLMLSGGITLLIGLSFRLFTTRKISLDMHMKEGYLVVALAWVFMSLTGALPYVLSGAIPSYTDAFFETMSGFTTTGATILPDIESLPQGILFWRSLTHWIGGMGIIVLAIAVMPVLGFGGMQMFAAEASGLTTDKLHPRITDTAKRLWIIYVLFTGLETVLLMLGEMDFYEALNHSMATIATGGFSTYNTSLVDASVYTQYVVTIFMFIAGINFSLHYFVLKGRFGKVFRNEEFIFYTVITALLGCVVTISLFWRHHLPLEEAFRQAFFHVVSIITTTGFVATDYEQWSPFLVYLIFVISFFGGCAGSTAGGLKMVRVRLLLNDSALELKRLLHPRAVIPVRINGKNVPREIMANVLAFFFFYILVFGVASLLLAVLGMDLISAMGSAVACLSNVGPGIGTVGAMDNYAHVPIAGKWLLSFLMLMGRLEIFTVLLILIPAFWKKI
ncbi:MAG: Trk system potassium transporter TrkH [Chitinophagales bacterium]|nr:MAG: Trk system potassium transporter TrkH [Chitinophagales bacterium]